MLTKALLIVQLVLAITLIILVLIQQQGSGLGASFGGTGGFHSTRRGPEKVVFITTVVNAVLFFLVSIAVVVF